jgi:phage tail-like protein
VSLPFPSGLSPSDPLTGFRFSVSFSDQSSSGGGLLTAIGSLLSLGGVTPSVGGFSEISGLDSSIEMFDYKEGGRNDYVHKFATRASFGNLNFKRGVALTPDLWQWYDKVRHGSYGARRGVTITHLNPDGSPALVWNVTRALPLKYTGPAWNAGQSSVAIESIEMAHEGLELVPTTLGGLISSIL